MTVVQPNGGQLLAQALIDAGVTVVFTLHGGHLNPFFEACRDLGIDLIDGRHETAVANAADGYARATGRLGVVAVTAGAGFANCLPALVSAHLDRIPLLVVTSSPPLSQSELNELQGGVDQIGIARPTTKWAHRVTTAHRIPDLVNTGMRKAVSGPPGPALLDVPIDLVYGRVNARPVVTTALVGERPAPAHDVATEALRLIRAAQRPVIVAGNGVRWAGARPILLDFVRRTGIPVFNQMTGFTGLPADHPLNGYGAWNLASIAEATGQRPDLVLLLGARMGRYLGGRRGSMVPHDATLIQIDVDASEMGRIRRVDLPIVADAAQTLRALIAADAEPFPDWSGWAVQAAAVHRRAQRFDEEPEYLDGRMHPHHAVRELLRSVGGGATIVVDGGEAAGWVGPNLWLATPGDVMGFGGYLGMLGTATGLAIGAQVARPGMRTILISGDGAAGFHIQEYDTMVRHRLPILTVVLNNALWAQSLRSQDTDFGPGHGVITRLRDTDYERVAEGVGAQGERVTRLDDIGPAVARAWASGRPSCLNLTVAYGPDPLRQPDDAATNVGATALPYYESVTASGR